MGKGKGAAGSALDALGGAGGGFSALLNSFDSGAVEDDTSAPQIAMDQPAPALQPPADSLLKFSPQDLPSDLQLLLAQANEVSVDKSPSLQATALGAKSLAPLSLMSVSTADLATQALTPGVQLPASAIASVTDFLVGSMPIPLSQGGSSKQAALPGLAGTGDVVASSSKGASGVVALDLSVGRLANVAVPVDLSLLQPGQGPQLRPQKSKAADGLSGVGNAMVDSRVQGVLAPVDIASRETAMLGALVSSGFGEGLTRSGDRNSGKPSFLLAGSGAEGLWGQSAFQVGPALEAPTVAAESASSSLESVVADTVSYWVTQGVKNAALKLDGFGEHPLEVNISMQGGEARIDFRTDQPEIRLILEGAMTHLKDLLKSEGVVLSGVSVGASGQNGAGSQDARDRPGARQGTVATTRASTDSPRPVSLPAGRVLDLFV
jgi:flagellar hook-length control protein FliK